MDLNDLVLKAKAGDKEALAKILERFKGFIYKTSKEVYIKGYDTEDLLQIGYTTLIKAVNKFDLNKNKNFTAYATSAVKNNFYYEIRQKSRFNVEYSLNKEIDEGIEIIENLNSDENIEEEYMLKESVNELNSALKKLLPKEKELILHVYFNHRTVKEFAKLNSMNYVTCVKLKDRTLKKLKKLMKQ